MRPPLSGLRQPVGGRVTGSGVEHLVRRQTCNEKNLQLKCLLSCLQTCVRVILPRWAAEPRHRWGCFLHPGVWASGSISSDPKAEARLCLERIRWELVEDLEMLGERVSGGRLAPHRGPHAELRTERSV